MTRVVALFLVLVVIIAGFGAVMELILLVLIIADWRRGERTRWAYPIALGVHVIVQVSMLPVSASSWRVAFCRWFAAARCLGR